MKKSRTLAVIAGLVLLVGGAYGANKFFKYQKEDVPVAVDIFQINGQNQAENKDPNETEITANESTLTSDQPSSTSDESEKKVTSPQTVKNVATTGPINPLPSTTTQENTDTSPTPSKIDDQKPLNTPSSTSTSKQPPPKELNLQLPFYSQAPFGNWDYPWQEACEEASVLLVANGYFKHGWTAEEFNREILKLVEWENKTFGSYEHTNMEQTAQIIKEYLHLDYKIHENPTFEDIQNIIAKGHLIVAPFAGRQIGNPYYTNGGPNYHVMVIKGYKEGKIITNDVGTRRGENYVYSWETIQKALHDYDEPITKGAKRIIEIIPPKK